MKNYFLKGTILGLVSAALVASLIMEEGFLDLWSNEGKYFGAIVILVGALASIGAGLFFDLRFQSPQFLLAALVFPPIIFISGALVGSLANFAVNGHFVDAYDWFVKPLFWLAVVGLPLSMIIGSFYFAFVKVWQENSGFRQSPSSK